MGLTHPAYAHPRDTPGTYPVRVSVDLPHPTSPISPVTTPVVVTTGGASMTWTLWTLGAGLACCAVEVAAALAAQDDPDDTADLGIEPFAPSPAEADLLLVSGTVTAASASLVRALYDGMPEPRHVIAYGACTASGGPYWDSYSVTPGIHDLVPVDLVVPGCPPRPEALIHALRTLTHRLHSEAATA